MIPAQAMFRRGPLAALLALSLAAAVVPAARAADPSQFSQAEKLVFVDHQLANVKAPATLRYRFARTGTLETPFEDDVRLDVKAAGTPCCTVRGEFLSGERQVKLPDMENAQANPVILFFLERDIREMERLTKGKSGYFRKRIRMGMVDAAQVKPVKLSFEGREIDAQEVTLSPYLDDPLRARYEKYAAKRYTFVLAPTVPGGVYQVRAALPGALPSDAPALEEVLTFAGTGEGAAPSNSK